MLDPSDISHRLAELSSLASKSAHASEQIHAGASARLATVNARLAELRPLVLTDQTAADEYQRLTLERGRLELVLTEKS